MERLTSVQTITESDGKMHEFRKVYEQMKKKRYVKQNSHFGIYGNVIEVWERKNGRWRNICRIEEDSEEECYKKALDIMKLYDKIF